MKEKLKIRLKNFLRYGWNTTCLAVMITLGIVGIIALNNNLDSFTTGIQIAMWSVLGVQLLVDVIDICIELKHTEDNSELEE